MLNCMMIFCISFSTHSILQGTYSTQIFSLAVLLSSMFIYNQVGFFFVNHIDSFYAWLLFHLTVHVFLLSDGRYR